MPPINRVNRVCETCGSVFDTVPSVVSSGGGKYCSRKCYWSAIPKHYTGENASNWHGGGVNCTCRVCGKVFVAGKSIVDKGDGKYCSWACQHHSLRGSKKEKNPNWKGMYTQCKCAVCGAEFERPSSAVRAGEGRFCSRACMGKWRSTQTGELAVHWKGSTTTGACAQCGKEMKVRSFRVKDGRDKFCSYKCRGQWHRNEINQLYGKTIYPSGWKKALKERVRRQSGYTCAMCGVYENGSKLSVHHIDYNKDNIDICNLIPLCVHCHTRTNFNRAYWTTAFQTGNYQL